MYERFLIGEEYYLKKYTTQADYRRAALWSGRGARDGDDQAQFLLGILYTEGNGVKQNYKKARYWLRKSASQGNAQALFHLGWMYEYGEGVRSERNKADEFYKDAKECSSVAYYHGLGEPLVDFYSGIPLWAHAVAGKDLQPEIDSFEHLVYWEGTGRDKYIVGEMYRLGKGLPQSYQKAVEWYEEAVKMGNPLACYRLGELYYEGMHVARDRQKAREYFCRACEKGLQRGCEKYRMLNEY